MDYVVVSDRQFWDAGKLLNSFANSDAIISAQDFDKSLGMKTKEEVVKQLSVDLPRCKLTYDNDMENRLEWSDIYNKVLFPRTLTQSVFAPSLEWLWQHGIRAFESNQRMHVHIGKHMNQISKNLNLMDHDQRFLGTVNIVITVYPKWVVVSKHFVVYRSNTFDDH